MSGFVTYREAGISGPTGEPYVLTYPKNYVPGSQYGVIFCHAALENEAPWWNVSYAGGKYMQLFQAIAQRYPVMCTWASYTDISLTGVTSTIAAPGVLTSAAPHGLANGDVLLVGGLVNTLGISNGQMYTAHAVTASTMQLLNADASGTSLPFTGSVDSGITLVRYQGDAWGNDAAVAKLDLAYQNLQAIGAKPGPIFMVGTSMGGLTVYSYMRQHPTNVKTAILVCPVSDLTNQLILANYTASINTAFGGSYVDDAIGDLHNPIRFCTLLRDTPMQMWIADDDHIADPVVAQTVLSAFRQTEVHHMLGGHNNLNDMSIPQALAWLVSHE